MRFFVTGGAGFIGSNLVDRLLRDDHSVVAFDNLSTGFERFFQRASESPRFSFERGDLLDADHLCLAMKRCDFVFHLAANADVRYGTDHPSRDLEQNTIATFNVLEGMRKAGIKRIAFSSTGSVYGEPHVIPTPEDAPFPIQTSLYGASKLAGEGLIQAYCEGFQMEGYIFRFVSILGEGYTHGHVFDFVKSLRKDPTVLKVLGDGHQEKSYLYVQDCIDAMLLAIRSPGSPVQIFNLGTNESCEVIDSIGWITKALGVNPEIRYSGGKRGWIGDNPRIFLDCSKIRSLGWKPSLSIQQGILKTVEYLTANAWVFEARA